jgi:4-hydroxythreonine-4-phosphate dehydrogenase
MEKRIVTMGDPRGVGTDLILIAAQKLGSDFLPTVIGSADCLYTRSRKLNLKMYEGEIVDPPNAPSDYMNNPGAAAWSYLDLATEILVKDKGGLLLTCPINKFAMSEAGFKYPGHTEYLAARSNVDQVFMLMANERLRVILTTVHEPMAKVPSLLTIKRVKDTILAAAHSLKTDFSLESPRIGVAGYNPHAGEGGLFGNEELEIIIPAINEAKSELDDPSVEISQPIPPDTIFYEALNGRYDMVITLYHDQGLIAVKTTDFHSTVNVTLGLPFVRTSPDHGTAFDLAGTGNVNPGSFLAAWNLGLTLAESRLQNDKNS